MEKTAINPTKDDTHDAQIAIIRKFLDCFGVYVEKRPGKPSTWFNVVVFTYFSCRYASEVSCANFEDIETELFAILVALVGRILIVHSGCYDILLLLFYRPF